MRLQSDRRQPPSAAGAKLTLNLTFGRLGVEMRGEKKIAVVCILSPLKNGWLINRTVSWNSLFSLTKTRITMNKKEKSKEERGKKEKQK